MGELVIDVKLQVKNFVNFGKALHFMKNNSVYVGIPQEETSREGSKDVTNAELLYIHTNGSPANNIPARPVIEPALKDDSERLSAMMKKASKLVFNGNKEEAIKQLKLVGMRGQNVSRKWFVNEKNGWPPNSPSVYRRKLEKESTDPKPLIDTGELRKSITYVVETKEGRTK